jgi:hypothetical protein
MQVRVTQLDGKLPNLALMRLAAYHRARGDTVLPLSRSPYDDAPLLERYDRVYGSAIFSFSAERVQRFKHDFPEAIVGGTHDVADQATVEDIIGDADEGLDYSLYPDFTGSLGFTARGCRFKCGFCVVPKKEGRPASVATVDQIWRGNGHPRHLHLLDNDFFGQPEEQWRERIAEIQSGKFKVCFNQGINIRMIDDNSAAALASVDYRDDQFERRRIYTAWDNLGDEHRFFRGVDCLEAHGISPKNLMAYMLIGYDRRETWERVVHRFDAMVERGIKPYPMVYGDRTRGLPLGDYWQRKRRLEPIAKLGPGTMDGRTLAQFQRWAIRQYYTVREFEHYDPKVQGHGTLLAVA